MRKKFLISVVIAFMALTTEAFGQSGAFFPGYIIQTNGDTLPGFIKSESPVKLSNQIQFKTALDEGAAQTFNPNDIAAFYFEPSFYFEASVIEEEGTRQRRFLRKLVAGNSSLYYLPGQQWPIFKITKSTGESIQLEKKSHNIASGETEDKRYVGKLIFFMQSCESLRPKINRTSFNADAIANLIVRYNECIGANNSLKLTSDKRKLSLALGPAIRYDNYQLDAFGVQVQNKQFSDSGTGIQGGAIAEMYYNKRLSLQVGFLYASYSANKNEIFSFGTITTDYEISSLNIPVNFKYLLTKSNTAPLIYAGVKWGLILRDQTLIRKVTSNVPDPDQVLDTVVDRLYGYQFGLGLEHSTGKIILQGLAGYTKLTNGINIDTRISSWAIGLNVLYTLSQ